MFLSDRCILKTFPHCMTFNHYMKYTAAEKVKRPFQVEVKMTEKMLGIF